MGRNLHFLVFAACLVIWHSAYAQEPNRQEQSLTDNCQEFEDGGFCIRGSESEETRSDKADQEEKLKRVFGDDGELAGIFAEANRDPNSDEGETVNQSLDDEDEMTTTPTTTTRRPRRIRGRPRREAELNLNGDDTRSVSRTKRQVDLTNGEPYVEECRERCWTVILRWWHWVYVRGRGWVRPVYWPPFFRQTLKWCIPCHRVQPFCRGATREIWGHRWVWLGRCVPEVKYRLILVWWSNQWPFVRWVWVRYTHGCCCVPWPYGLPQNQWDWNEQRYEQSPAYPRPTGSYTPA